MDDKICFYDRVIAQKSEKNTILYNANFMQLAKVTTEIYELIYTICKDQICLEEVILAMDTDEDKNYFLKILESLYAKKIVKSIAASSEYLDMNIQIDLDLTNRCNLHCRHCCVSANSTSHDLSLNNMISIVDKIIKLNPYYLVISGGEPLIRDDFKMIIDRIRSTYKGNLSLMTNAILIDNKMAKYISKNFDSVSVSLDGFDEETCSIIRGKGTFSKTITGINNLKDAGMKKISVSMVITKDTSDKKQDFINFCHSIDVEPMIRALSIVGRAKGQMEDYIVQSKDKSDDELLLQVKNSDKEISQGNFDIFNCGAAYKQFQIDYKGNIYPCQSLMEEDLLLGNILEIDDFNSFIRRREFTESSGYKHLEKYFPYNFRECKDCNKQLFCWNCVAELYRKPKKLSQCEYCKLAFDRFFI